MSGKRAIPKLKKKDTRLRLILTYVGIGMLFLLIAWLGKQIYDLRTHASATSWVENNRDLFRNSSWFIQHGYSDCPSEGGGYWPTSQADCLITEPASGPSVQDQISAPDPGGLYYKHLLPTDFFSTIPGLLLNLNYKSITKAGLEQALEQEVTRNPSEYAQLSVDSIYVGLEGGISGTNVRSLSLMVHPTLERPISGSIGVLQRAKNLYKPFIEGATGATISDADLTDLYTAAMNRCGSHSLNNDQTGAGAFKIVGEFAVIVQTWLPDTSSSLIGGDCNIHVVKLVPQTLTVTPTEIAPTYACLGTSCVPTDTPSPTIAITRAPAASPTSTEPTEIVPTATPEISDNPSQDPTPAQNPGKGDKGFFKFLLELIEQFLRFFMQLFNG